MIELVTTLPGTGKLLVAEPFMRDQHFKRTVVLVTNYTESEGVVGYVLNKPTEFLLQDLLPDLESTNSFFNPRVFLGGPVSMEYLQFIHTMGRKLEGAQPVNDKLWMGGNFEQLIEMIKTDQLTENDVRFFIGYSGWGYDQFKVELEANSWIVAEPSSQLVFNTDKQNDLWKKVISSLGKQFEPLVSYPEDVAWN